MKADLDASEMAEMYTFLYNRGTTMVFSEGDSGYTQ
jgi:hypothetical protein